VADDDDTDGRADGRTDNGAANGGDGTMTTATPDLRPIDRDTANGIVSGLFRLLGASMPFGLDLKLRAFAESRTLHDLMRIERALRHADGMDELAEMVLASIPEDLRGLVKPSRRATP
jgi:hypothetical protein